MADNDEHEWEQPCILCPVALENATRLQGELLHQSLCWVPTRAAGRNFLECSEEMLGSSDEEPQQDNVEAWRAKLRPFGEDRTRARRTDKDAAETFKTRKVCKHVTSARRVYDQILIDRHE